MYMYFLWIKRGKPCQRANTPLLEGPPAFLPQLDLQQATACSPSANHTGSTTSFPLLSANCKAIYHHTDWECRVKKKKKKDEKAHMHEPYWLTATFVQIFNIRRRCWVKHGDTKTAAGEEIRPVGKYRAEKESALRWSRWRAKTKDVSDTHWPVADHTLCVHVCVEADMVSCLSCHFCAGGEKACEKKKKKEKSPHSASQSRRQAQTHPPPPPPINENKHLLFFLLRSVRLTWVRMRPDGGFPESSCSVEMGRN